jgi:hypothetical protein
LRFANPSPPSGWVEDFHLQAIGHARHTIKKAIVRWTMALALPGFQCAQAIVHPPHGVDIVPVVRMIIMRAS